MITIAVFVLIFLYFLSAFWASSETALASLSKYRIKKIIALNKALADPLGVWLRSPYYLLITILVGNTITDLLISNISSVVVLRGFGFLFHLIPRGAVEIITWLGVTALIIVFGELTPKIYGRRYPERVTLFVLPILSRIIAIVQPFARPVVALLKFIFPRLDVRPFSRLSYLSLEEVRTLIGEANTSGELGAETSSMLERTLNLSDREVSKIMIPLEKMDSVDADLPEEKLLDLITEIGRSRVPLYRGDRRNIIGFIYAKDLLGAWQEHKGINVNEFIRPVYSITAGKKVFDLLKEFQTGKTHIAFVADTSGKVTGIVTLEDVLEAILGEILDEYDLKKPQAAKA